MEKIVPPLIAYIVVCLIGIWLLGFDSFDTIVTKLGLVQVYAIPVFVIVAMVSFFVNR